MLCLFINLKCEMRYMPKNKYAENFIKKIKIAINDEKTLSDIVNKIYEDGFEDGYNECKNE